jgi:hypothetical protein
LTLAGIGCLTFAVGCPQSEVVVGVPNPGAAARITFEEQGFAGGHGTRYSVTLDSATAAYTVTTCSESVGVACESTVQQRSGIAPLSIRNQLFARTAMRDFRQLRGEYRRESAVVPPDPYHAEVTVTTGERTRTIAWEKDAVIPDLLATFVCHLRSVTGELILCPPL